MTLNDHLLSKYNVPVPRYTSYPTVPYWDANTFSKQKWIDSLTNGIEHGQERKECGLSLYVHLPFCESMCTFCGCTKRITKNHLVEVPYIKALLRELQLYIDILGQKPIVKQLHLGGGTPTFFSDKNLEYFLSSLFKMVDRAEYIEFSFEGHPNNTTDAHLKMFRRHGFTRVCYGVQDYNTRVQKAINRIQSFENVKSVTINARKQGFTSVGHDIIYGLPFQRTTDVINTIEQTVNLRPDRIAFYSYAHVPWIKGNGQRGYNESDLPSTSEKIRQHDIGKKILLQSGYREIGMDHFALNKDELYKAKKTGSLHRNFMGYTPSKTHVMIGLGVSAIGDSWFGFAQNVKTLKEYYNLLNNGQLPLFRGHILSREDLRIRQHILNLMCHFETSWNNQWMKTHDMIAIIDDLRELECDGLVILEKNGIKVTEIGKPFIRNICLCFDLRLKRQKPETKVFSMTV